MSDDQFTKLFAYMQEFRSEVSLMLDDKASQASVDRLTNTIDQFAARIDENDIEQGARDLRFERLYSWAKEASRKTGIPLRDLAK